MRSRGISLANKCQLLFGAAILLILTAALSVPWFRMHSVIDRGEQEIAVQLADAWLQNVIELGVVHETGQNNADSLEVLDEASLSIDTTNRIQNTIGRFRMEVLTVQEAEWRIAQNPDEMLQKALKAFRKHPETDAQFSVERQPGKAVRYRYLRPISARQMAAVQDPRFALFDEQSLAPDIANPLRAILVIERNAVSASGQLFVNRLYIILAGLSAGALAVLVFYFITTRLILSPVRVLRETAERVSEGNLYVRSDISTGDEFEELADTFNLMLSTIKTSQDQLRQINKSLDLKMTDLAKSNVTLLEANRLKSEFLANISHELRTPLNSILGFAEVIAELEEAATDQTPGNDKKQRYLNNIITSGKHLLQMINDLLDLARIEAGRVEIQAEPINIHDVCDGLLTLLRPQSEKKQLRVVTEINPNLPLVETDGGKLQQIIFNFLSNAVKFTPDQGSIVVRAERWRDTQQGAADMVRISVADTGPGISQEDQKHIFEKFRQVEASHTKQHQGTGLGLAICQELSELLHATIEVESELENGTTFRLILPIQMPREDPQPLMSEITE